MKLPGFEHIETPLILAPMEGITDTVFRRICLAEGADAGISEFISSEAIIRQVAKSLKKMDAAHVGELRWVQLFGNNPSSVAEAARVAEANGAHIIDLNFGCPVKKVVSKGNGAALLRNLPLMQEIAQATVNAVHIPVTSKTRLGWDAQSIVVNEAALRLQDAGIQALTIHGRTRAQQYSGQADWKPIATVKETLAIPVIVNGDITSPEKALEALHMTHADGMMIGRAAIGNPWLFGQIKSALSNKPVQPVSLEQKFQTCRSHLSESIRLKGEKTGVLEMRKHFVMYFKGLPGFKPFKLALLAAITEEEIHRILNEAQKHYN